MAATPERNPTGGAMRDPAPRSEHGREEDTARLVFLTGATGFIGSRLARRLVGRGDRLRCLVRETSDTADLERLGAELIVGDLVDADVLARGMDGAAVAYHIAAIYEIGALIDEARLRHVNVGGTRAFLDAAERTGVPRAVYVSTAGALAPAPEGELGDPRAPLPPDYTPPTAYQRTKAEAHGLARDAQDRALPVIIASPGYVYGPGDATGPSGRFIVDLLAGRVPALPRTPTYFSFVHIDDVVDGLVRAGERGRPGAEYVFGGEPASVVQFARRVAEVAGRRPPRLRYPTGLVRLGAILLDPISRLTGVRFPVSREDVEVADGWRFIHSWEETAEELDWRPRMLDEGLPETVAWVQEYLG